MGGIQLRENTVYNWLVTKIIFLGKEKKKETTYTTFKNMSSPSTTHS